MTMIREERTDPRHDEQAQSLIEYIILVALVAVALIFSTQELGTAITAAFTDTAASMASPDLTR